MKNLFLVFLIIPVFAYGGLWPAYHNTTDRKGIAMRYGPNCCDTVCSAPIEWSRASPVIDGVRNVYMQGGVSGSGPWCLWKVNADNCVVKWTLQISAANPASAPQATCALSGDSVIYFGTISDSSLWAVDSGGTLKWKYKLNNKVRSSPVVTEDGLVIYVMSDKGCLYAINSDSTLKWKDSIPAFISQHISSPAIGPDGHIYTGSTNNRLYAIDSSDGSFRWSYNTGDYINSTPAIGSDTIIYFGCENGRLYALYSDGTVKWSYNTGDIVNSSPALDEDREIVYVGANNNRLFAVNMSDGSLKWSLVLHGDPGLSSPAVAYSNNMIYIGDLSNYVYVIENMTDSGKIICDKVHNYEITSPAIDYDTSIWYNEYSYALHKLKCWEPPGSIEELSYEKGIYLRDNLPNPFSKETQISFSIAKESKVSLEVYDVSGRMVRELVSGNYAAGKYTVKWNGRDSKGKRVNAGVYLYKLKSGSVTLTKKMTLMAQ